MPATPPRHLVLGLGGKLERLDVETGRLGLQPSSAPDGICELKQPVCWWVAHHRARVDIAALASAQGVRPAAVRAGVEQVGQLIADDWAFAEQVAVVTARALLTPVQRRALQQLTTGRARISNSTDAVKGTVARSTVRALERLGLAHDLEVLAVISEQGRAASRHLGEEPDHVYDHGSSACYVLDGCRCLPCKAAHSEHEQTRTRSKAYGRPVGTVDAGPVRDHVATLMVSGVGLKRIAAVAGVAPSTVSKLIYGTATRPPSRRVRAATRDRLLAVCVTDLADGTAVDGASARAQVDWLLAQGFSRAEIGRLLTGNPDTSSLQVGRNGLVSVATARRIAGLQMATACGEVRPLGKRTRHRTEPVCSTAGCGDPQWAGVWCRQCLTDGVAREVIDGWVPETLDARVHEPEPVEAPRPQLPAGPLIEAVERRGGIGAVTAGRDSRERARLRRAYHRAVRDGKLTETAADDLAVRLLGVPHVLLWPAIEAPDAARQPERAITSDPSTS